MAATDDQLSARCTYTFDHLCYLVGVLRGQATEAHPGISGHLTVVETHLRAVKSLLG